VLDFETQSFYQMDVLADDGSGFTRFRVNITVNDVNEAPQLPAEFQSTSTVPILFIKENATAGTNLSHIVDAWDPDASDQGGLVYSFVPDSSDCPIRIRCDCGP
jgi:hypothetical protein